MDRESRLVAAMRAYILRSMPPHPFGAAASIDLRSLVHDYAAWRGRLPPAFPRRVQISEELLGNPSRESYADGLAAVVRELAFGESLAPRLSTAVLHAYDPVVPRCLAANPDRQRKDRDLLLSTWMSSATSTTVFSCPWRSGAIAAATPLHDTPRT